MENTILTLAFVANLLGVYVGIRSSFNSKLTGFRSVKFWLYLILVGVAGYAVDHFGPALFGLPLKLAQNPAIVQDNAIVFAAAASLALFSSLFSGWCLGYVGGLFHKATRPAPVAAATTALPATPPAFALPTVSAADPASGNSDQK